MKRDRRKYPPYFDDHRDRAFVTLAALFWLVVLLFLVLRDPVWRLLHEGEILGTVVSSGGAKGSELDEGLISQLASSSVKPVAGLEPLEQEIVSVINDKRTSQLEQSGVAGPPGTASDALRDIARSQAERRLSDPKAAPLRYPLLSLSLLHPRRLVRSVEKSQSLYQEPPAGSDIMAETVGGWMNDPAFASAIGQPHALEVGAAAIARPNGGPQLNVIVMEVFVEFDAPLPAVTNQRQDLSLVGKRLSSEETALYFKGPKEASFAPLQPQWSGDRFHVTLEWNQGVGLYYLRAGRAGRLSDPRPILVK